MKLTFSDRFEGSPPISKDVLKSLVFSHKLPNDYLEFIQQFNGGEINVGESYLVLHKIEELTEINQDYEIDQFDSNILIIGSNGSSELMALAYRFENTKYILIPSIFEYNANIELGTSLEGFFHRIYDTGYFGS